MQLSFSPIRSDASLTLSRAGDTLMINGELLDLSFLPEGASLPAQAIDCPWIAGAVQRQGGVLHIPLLLPHGAAAPHEARFPAPLDIDGDGPVTLPDTHPGEEAEE